MSLFLGFLVDQKKRELHTEYVEVIHKHQPGEADDIQNANCNLFSVAWGNATV